VARLRLCVSSNKNQGQDVDLGKYWHVMWGIVRCNSCEETSLTIPYNFSSGAAIRLVKGLVLHSSMQGIQESCRCKRRLFQLAFRHCSICVTLGTLVQCPVKRMLIAGDADGFDS